YDLGSPSSASMTINDNDYSGDLPRISIGNASDTENHSQVFLVTLSCPSNQTVTVAYATADGSAKVSQPDYSSTSGTLTFGTFQTSQNITVPVTDDSLDEDDETF